MYVSARASKVLALAGSLDRHAQSRHERHGADEDRIGQHYDGGGAAATFLQRETKSREQRHINQNARPRARHVHEDDAKLDCGDSVGSEVGDFDRLQRGLFCFHLK